MTKNRGGLIAALIAVVIVVGIFIYAMNDDATDKPGPATNGDMLGMESGESFENYRQRAAETLVTAPADEDVFGLITFTEPLNSARADDVTSGLSRVNAMIVGMAAPYALPEPVAGVTRTDVFDLQFQRIANSLSGVVEVPVPEQMTAVVAYDNGEVMRSVAEDPRVATVETLPPDAAWHQFGVRPVEVPGVDQMSVAVPGVPGLSGVPLN